MCHIVIEVNHTEICLCAVRVSPLWPRAHWNLKREIVEGLSSRLRDSPGRPESARPLGAVLLGPGQGCGKHTGTATTTLTRVLSQPHRGLVVRNQESYTISQSWFSRYHKNGDKTPCLSELLRISDTMCHTPRPSAGHGEGLDERLSPALVFLQHSLQTPQERRCWLTLSPRFHSTYPLSIHICRATKRCFTCTCVMPFIASSSKLLLLLSPSLQIWKDFTGFKLAGALSQLPWASEGPQRGAY